MYTHSNRIIARLSYLVIDIIFIYLSFFAALFLKNNLKFTNINIIWHKPYPLIFTFWGISLIFILNNLHLYSTDRSLTIPQENFRVLKAVFYSVILFEVIVAGLKIEVFPWAIFIIAALFLFVNLSLWRILKRVLIRRRIAKGHYNFNVLIIGAGKSGRELIEEIEDNPYLGFKVVGLLDDYKNEGINNCEVLGKIKDLENIIQKYFVDEIYITIPSQRDLVSDIITRVKILGRSVKIVADNFCIPVYRVRIGYIGFIPLVSYYERSIHGTESFIKRVLDVIMATILLILLLPLFLIICFIIKLDSPGKILYISRRAGRKGRIFNFYKFRSMYTGADKEKDALRHKSEVKGPIFKIKDDPRITSFGKFLRRYSLDELPQLINVLRGDMSLVGPRPLPVEESAQCEIWQLRRLEVRPGLACMAQVRGRSNLSFYKWMKWDLWYIDNWSFGLDLKILFWMAPAVLKRRGAY